MRTLVLIRASAKDAAIVRQNLPWYLKSGCDLAGVDGRDSQLPCWPSDAFKFAEAFGPTDFPLFNYGGKQAGSPMFLVEMFEWCLLHDYDSFLATEADSMFVGPVPGMVPSGFGTFIAGYCPPHWGCGDGPFLHPPFWMSRETAKRFTDVGRVMAERGDTGNGSPDVFTGMVCVKAQIPIEQQQVYSTNGLDMRCASKLMAARTAYNTGAWHIHGVKRQDHIDYISGATNELPKDVILE